MEELYQRARFLRANTKPVVCVVLGTRPGIIKSSPLLHRLRERAFPHFVIHSGQHYSENMDAVFFDELRLDQPDFRIGSLRPGALHGEQTAEMLAGIERILLEKQPRLVLVGGDANTNLAGALAARKLDLLVGHVEAGLRSRDWRMPEEHNRVMIDHISDVLFAPSQHAAENLKAENIQGDIQTCGSTVGEALHRIQGLRGPEAEQDPLIPPGGPYVLVTLHRQENVDVPEVFGRIVTALRRIPDALGRNVLWPVHPRAMKRLGEFSLLGELNTAPRIHLLPPVRYSQFASLLKHAQLVLTDSGGVQQEACICRVPCVTARPTTEWIETQMVGANSVVGTDAEAILNACLKMIDVPRDWEDPFSPSGAPASHRIVDVCGEVLAS